MMLNDEEILLIKIFKSSAMITFFGEEKRLTLFINEIEK
jgi:hypothetical protein